MLTMECLIKKKLPITHKLTEEEKNELKEENKNKNYSYQCLLQEHLCYNPTIEELLSGWSGIQLFKI